MGLKLISILVNSDFNLTKILGRLPSNAYVTLDEFDDNTGASFETTTSFNLVSGTDVVLDNLEMTGVLKRQTNP